MSGFHPLSPGVALMRRLRLRGKLLLLAASAVLPLLLVWGLQGSGSWQGSAPVLPLLGLGVLAYLMLSFYASFTVLDLDTLVYCDDADLCWVGDPFPKTVAQLEARYMRDPEDGLPLFHDTTHQLSFEAIAGHRYLTIGLMEVETSNGGRVSFDNSLRLTGVAAPEGALRSSVVGGDLASAFLTPVPEPASEWLWMAGLGLLALRRRPEQA